jgi:hypothetical protein
MPKKKNPDRGEMLALAMAEGTPIARWARENKVNERAAYRLAARPGVRERAAALRSQLVDHAIGLMGKAAATAVTNIWIIMQDDAQPAMTRLKAAEMILSCRIEQESHATLEAKFAELQRQLADIKNRKHKGAKK